MVEETMWKDVLEVPTQEWLRKHSDSYEEIREEDRMSRRDRMMVGALSVIVLVFMVAILATWGGY